MWVECQPPQTNSADTGAGAVLPLRGAEDEAAGGDAGAGGDQHRAVPGYLVDRGAADLADRLGDAVHAVDVGLAKLAAVRVQRQRPAQFYGPVGDEVPGLPARAETKLLQL